MPWGRVDDHHYRHEKVGELSEDLRKGCIALYWLAISWCNDRLTDGRVPVGTVRILGGDFDEADELVRVGLWETDGKGYRVHDFLDFNKSKAQVESEKAQRTAAGQASGRARWRFANDPANDVVNEPLNEVANEALNGSDAPVTRTPSPVTPFTAEPISRELWPNINDEAVTFLEGMTGRMVRASGDRNLTEYDRQLGDHGLASVMAAYRKAAKLLPSTPKPTARQLVWSSRNYLEPFVDPKAIASEDKAVADEKRDIRRNEAIWERRVENYRHGGQWDPAWGEPPDVAA